MTLRAPSCVATTRCRARLRRLPLSTAAFVIGMIYFQFPFSTTSKTFTGKVTGGTGAYSDATGTISGKSISSTKGATTIVISYTRSEPPVA
jgi:hypothetical protein